MAFCMNCGKQLPKDAKFCYDCGAAVKPMDQSGSVNVEKADVEISISAFLNNDNKQEFTQNEVYLKHANKTVSVRIPNWITVGQTLRLRGEGVVTQSGSKGDLLLRIAHVRYKGNNNQAPTRKVGYEGEIRKCPNCGDIIGPYETICDACGFEIRGRSSTSVVHELVLKLEGTDDEQKKDELIRTFYIPNTNEDIREFFILALSNIKVGGMNTDAWMVKLEQAYQKAELTVRNEQELERLKHMYVEAIQLNRKNSTINNLKKLAGLLKTGFGWALLFGIIGVIFLLINIPFENTILYVIAGASLYVAFGAVLLGLGGQGKKKDKSINKKNKGLNKQNYIVASAGKDAEEFLGKNYDDMVEFLHSRGFENIITKAERKGLLNTEGAIKGISIAGNTDFGENDEFDINAKILIRYYSKNYYGG